MSRKLEIGSGNRPLEGYEHLDINPDCPCVEYVSSMGKIPCEDNAFDEIQAIHVIEHQPWKETLATLTEWIRVLKAGGKLRIATPNLKFIAQSYIDARGPNQGRMLHDINIMNEEERSLLTLNEKFSPALWANFKIMSGGGKWDQHFACYDADILTEMLMLAGACKVDVVHDGDSLVVEAYK